VESPLVNITPFFDPRSEVHALKIRSQRHWTIDAEPAIEGLKLFSPRAFPDSKTHPAGFAVTTQLTHLALAGPSMTRKRHESVMSPVMGSDPKL